MTTTTPYMSLTIPDNGSARTIGTYGQDWALYVNEDFIDIDVHDHSIGNGNQIPVSAIKFDYLNTNSFNLTSVGYVNYNPVTDPSSVGNNSIFVSGVDLYFKNAASNIIRITEDGGLPTVGDAGFYGDYGDDGSTAAFFGDIPAFNFYGLNSADFAEISCKSTQSINVSPGAFTGFLNGTADGVFTSAANSMADRLTGGLIKAVSDPTTINTDSYPFFPYRDSKSCSSLFSTPYSPTNSVTFPYITYLNSSKKGFSGGIDLGYNWISDQNKNSGKLSTYVEVDFVETVCDRDGNPGDGWVITTLSGANGSLITPAFQKEFTIYEDTPNANGTGKFALKRGFFLNMNLNAHPDIVGFPSVQVIETNYGDHKLMTVSVTGNYCNSAGNVIYTDYGIQISCWSMRAKYL